jgi:hypothetical protein
MAKNTPFGKFPMFEKSPKDKESRGMKEGSRKEEVFDRRQAKKPAKRGR